jgi:hypothetical protein
MKHLFTLLFSSLLFSFTYAQSIVYVTQNGSGNQSGSSWSNSLPGIELPNQVAAASTGTQFWLAKGTYKPTTSTNQAVSFTIASGVSVYGGFAGNETDLKQRKLNQNETILSGDLGIQYNQTIYSEILIYISDLRTPIRIDGLTIRDTYQITNREGGGGIHVDVSAGVHSLQVTNCRFLNHRVFSTFSGGGGIMVFSREGAHCNITIQNCYFANNLVGYGGAYMPYSAGGTHTSLVEDCIFDSNRVYHFGGAISNYYSSSLNSLIIRRCQFLNNTSGWAYANFGGALDIAPGTNTIEDCLFANNSTPNGKGGAVYISASQPTFKKLPFRQ